MQSKLKKALLGSFISLIVLFVLIIAFISPIAQYAVQKYDVKYLGREIKMGWLYLNPFTGYLRINNLRIYEPNSDSLILTSASLSADFQMFKLFSKTYEINTVTLDKPVGYIIQDGKTFNFSDLIVRFRPKHKNRNKARKRVHFNILNIKIVDGEFHYIVQKIPINYFIKHVNITSPGKWWNIDSMTYQFDLQSGPAPGKIKGNAAINFSNSRYRVAVKIDKFDLGLINQYLQELVNDGQLTASLDADIKGEGSLRDKLDHDASGFIAINDLHFGKAKGDDLASFKKLVLDAEKINPKNNKYYLDSIMIDQPFFLYERYDKLNNLANMFGKKGAKIKQAQRESDAGNFNLIIEIGKYIRIISKNFLRSNYTVGKVVIYDGHIKYNDYSLREKFTVEVKPLYLRADSIARTKDRFLANFKSGILPYGNMDASVSIDPNNYGNFNLRYQLQNVAVTMFNPFLVSYTSFPLDRGKLEFSGKMDVKDSVINSENHLLILDPRVAKRVKKKDTKWIPVPFIMALVRSTGNAIDFNIPIRGDLTDPKFKIWGAIGEVVKNIFVKPPSVGYLVHVGNVEKVVETSLSLTWQMRDTDLRPQQEKFVKRMVDFINKNKEATLTIVPKQYEVKEKEHILLYEAKKKFFMQMNKLEADKLTDKDIRAIDKMSVKDSAFIHYLDGMIGDKVMVTSQEKCEFIIGTKMVNMKFNELIAAREKIFKSYFGENVQRIKFERGQNIIPFNGFSYYSISYNGKIPDELKNAYDDLEDLNEKSPREKYADKRKKNLR